MNRSLHSVLFLVILMSSYAPATSFAGPRHVVYYNANTTPVLADAEELPYTHYIL